MQWHAPHGYPINIKLIKVQVLLCIIVKVLHSIKTYLQVLYSKEKYYCACPVPSVTTFPIFMKLCRKLSTFPPPIIAAWSEVSI